MGDAQNNEKIIGNDRAVSPVELPEDAKTDLTLRPSALDDFIGQDTLKRQLSTFLSAAKKRNEPIEHTLLYGPPGLGKTTLAHIIAREMGKNIRVTSGPAIEIVLISLVSRSIFFRSIIRMRLLSNVRKW